ncbi:MAG: DUF4124 domain-containing protein [Halieaceae bacterium]|nr:DUF4124 domain-containing protein [Halieaceae bacterium]
MKYLLILLFCTLLGTTASAQVYRVVDEHGNVTFTDKPPGDAEPVEIREPNTTAPPDTSVFPAPPPKPADEQDESGGYQVAITAPANETIIPRGPGNFSVSATVSPSLGRDHMLQLMMDGQPREEPQTSTSWALTNVFRGEHNITVTVIDKEGKTLATSEPVKVFVFRPSSQFRNNPRPAPR